METAFYSSLPECTPCLGGVEEGNVTSFALARDLWPAETCMPLETGLCVELQLGCVWCVA